MKKSILSWMTIALMAFVCVGFAACGGSDDDDDGGGSSSSNPLYGTWKASGSNSYWSWTETLTFSKSTATYEAIYIKPSGEKQRDYDTWNYNVVDYSNGAGHVYELATSGDRRGQERVVTFVISGKSLTYNGFGSTFYKE